MLIPLSQPKTLTLRHTHTHTPSTSQVNDLVRCIGVEVHVPAQLVVAAAAAGMETPVGAALHVCEALWRGEPEDATLFAAV